MKSLKGRVTIRLFGDYLCLVLLNVEMRFMSGFSFVKVLGSSLCLFVCSCCRPVYLEPNRLGVVVWFCCVCFNL